MMTRRGQGLICYYIFCGILQQGVNGFAGISDVNVGNRITKARSFQANAASADTRDLGLDVFDGEKTTKNLEHAEQDVLDLADLSVVQVKEMLLDLLPRMTGLDEEFRAVESYVNTLEGRYMPVQTLEFLNLAMSGEWQLLFSTNLAGGPKPNFRLRELIQRIEPGTLNGNITNEATWDLADDGSTFDTSGTFSAMCSYEINQGSRMVTDLDDHVLSLAKGSKVRTEVPALVGMLHRAMPKELFDPSEHAMDTTYLDGDLRIVRMAGPRLEGVRDIYIRKGSIEINPSAS